MKITPKRSFYVSTPALTIPQMLTIQNTQQNAAQSFNREMKISPYCQLGVTMHHTWFLPPRRVLEGSLPPPPSPVQQERRCNNYVHLVCICPKPCSKKGESTGNWRPERRGLGNTGGTTDCLLRRVTKGHSTCLGFLLKFTRPGGDNSCRRRDTFKNCMH